ncbi:unnamed protein product [marine sediment metagenome]|uniref:Uncharacterized protein n=1 Tax=marine sediment metagenome TaxID=412755 RepID=X1MWV3_9ZZZZ
MVIEKLSDGDPSVLAIGTYGGDQVGFDSVLGTKLIDQLKKLVGGYRTHKCFTSIGEERSHGNPAERSKFREDGC